MNSTYNSHRLDIKKESGSIPTNSFYSTNAFEDALNKPTVAERCQSLTLYLQENADIKDWQSQFPLLVQRIFGFNRFPPGWLIENMHCTQKKRDADAVLQFLSAEGPVFSMINRLLAEDIFYDFPLSLLPEATKRKLEEGAPISDLYANKISTSGCSPCVLLNSFEYFFFIFVYKMVDSSTKTQNIYSEPSDWCYPMLLNGYLQHFLPLSGCPLPAARPPSFSTVPMIQLHRTVSSSTPCHNRRSGLSLFKQVPSLQRVISPQISSGDTLEGDILWRSERLVQILVEFWMGQTNIDTPSSPAYARLMNEFMPSHDLIMLVRVLIKHLHAFCNTSQGQIIPSHKQNTVTAVGALKRALISRYVQRPLYGFLKNSFERWPLDTSFRPILETWLTFLRPWRYCDSRVSEEAEAPVDYRLWDTFIKTYTLFYTVLLQEVLTRFLRIDLTSVKMAFQLSRVTKTFSTPGLFNILEEIEKRFPPGLYYDREYCDNSTASDSAGIQVTLANQVADLEAPNYCYSPLFAAEFVYKVQLLLQQIATALSKVSSSSTSAKPSDTTSKDSSFLHFIGLGDIMTFNSSFGGPSERAAEEASAQKWLSQSLIELAALFKLQAPQVVGAQHSDSPRARASCAPDHTKTKKGLEITELGRYQLLNQMRRFQLEYTGDPELQPIRSFESAALVRWLYQMSCSINKKYGDLFQRWYSREDYFGHIARRYLNVHARPSQSPVVQEACSVVPRPRISLRFLANYHVLFYFVVICITLCSVFGLLPSLVLIVSLIFLYGICGAAFDSIVAMDVLRSELNTQ